MTRFSEELKSSVIKRMIPPQSESVNSLSRETGIPEVTLYTWKKKFKDQGVPLPAGITISERWSTQDKFSIVVETSTLNEIELSEYCRSKGLYVEEVRVWRDACMQANGGVAKQATELQKVLREKELVIKKLNQELRRKESALAETAAILVLRKNANAIWGDSEDE